MINSMPVHRHVDHRRILTEWVKDFHVRNCKVIETLEDCELGNHYHKEKDELFYLFKGSGVVELDGKAEPLEEGDTVFVGRETKHTFKLKKDSILLEAGTKPFDKSDDYKT